MTTLVFLINLAGATMLLLFAVRMVQTGIERSMGPSFKRIITSRKDSRLQTVGAGLVLAIVLQSATAAALLAAGFTGSGLITFVSGFSVVLGADLGSALVVQILSFNLDWLIPVLLVVGGYLFLKVELRTPRQVGRILLGVAFILLALRLLGEAVNPIRESAFLPAIAGYLETDYITAFFVGAAVSFVMHSSVAAILMTVTFVSIGVLPVQAGVSLVIGANLGSAALMIWLSRGMSNTGRRILYGNLFPRGFGAVAALFIVNFTPLISIFDGLPDGQVLVATHLLFNTVLVVTALPFVKLIEGFVVAVMPQAPNGAVDQDQYRPLCALDQSVLETPTLALASLTREVLRMSQIVEVMAQPVMELYRSGDPAQITAIQKMDDGVNDALSGIRRYAANIPKSNMSKEEFRRSRDLTEYSINLEIAGDIICKTLLPLAKEKVEMRLRFSPDGREELERLHERVMSNMALAFNVLVSEDIECARLLMEEKSEMTQRERKSRKRHLKRLRAGSEDSFESSDIHLETLRGLKDLNSQIAAVAYPILYKHGQLLETRLLETMDENEDQSESE